LGRSHERRKGDTKSVGYVVVHGIRDAGGNGTVPSFGEVEKQELYCSIGFSPEQERIETALPTPSQPWHAGALRREFNLF
jgi:hypothetical protein